MPEFDVGEEVRAFLAPDDLYQLWFSLGGKPFRLLASHGLDSQHPPSNIPTHQDAVGVDRVEKGCIETWFSYPNGGFFVIRHHGTMNWNAQDRRQIYRMLHSYYANRMIERQQHILQRMTESIRAITSILDLDELLTKILENAMAVLPAANVGNLMMYEEKLGKLVCKAAVGATNEEYRKFQSGVGEGITGLTFRDGKPRLYQSREDFLRDSSTHTKENFDYLRRSFDLQNVKSTVSVPIAVDGKTKCVLIINQNGDYPLFTEYDLQLIQSFADQVSIAISNVSRYHDLNRQNQTLVDRHEIHTTLMNLSLQNKGADVIVNKLRRMIRLPLVFIDLLDYDYYPKLKRWYHHVQINELENTFGACRTPFYHEIQTQEGKQFHYIYPIIAMNICLGFILVEVQGRSELTQTQQIVLEQGSRVLALEMVRKQSLTDFYSKKTNELFSDLLLQKDAALLRKKAEELGINYRHSLAVAIFEIPSLSDTQIMNLQVHRLVNTVKQKFGQRAPVVFSFRNTVVVSMEIITDKGPSEAMQQCRQLIREWEGENGTALRAGVGNSYDDLQKVAKSYNEAEKALSYLELKQRTGLIGYSDIGINRLLIHHAEEIESFIEEVFVPLRSSEDNRLEETLLAYFACNRSNVQAAEKLHIHINTLYQRLRKIEELINLSFDDPEHMLKLQLACYLYSSNFVE